MIPYNRGEIPQALSWLLGIKGKFESAAEGTLIPGVNVADLFDTPYLRYGIPVCRGHTQSAGAALNSYVMCRPGQSKALQITQVIFTAQSGVAQRATLRILTAANLVTVGFAASAIQMLDLSSNAQGAAAALLSSQVSIGTNNGNLGTGFATLGTASGEQVIYSPPAPGIILFGNDEGGIPGLAVVGTVQNEAISATFVGREWPLPG